MIKIIIFDFDGVIEDNYEKHYELSCKQFIGLTREQHRKLSEGNIHIERERLKHLDTGFDLPTIFNKHKVQLTTKPNVAKTIKNLSNKYKLGIISSAREEGINTYLKKNKLEDCFSFVYGLETHKLKDEKFKLVMEEFNLKKEDMAFVTDTLGDILEANKLDIVSIAVDFGFHEKERLEKGNPFKIVSKFEDISETIKELEEI